MCLIYFAHRVDPRFPLVVAANRDEFHARETQAAHWWDDDNGVLAGRDLRAGGTWMGVSRSGRFAAITNYRDPHNNRDDARSRGFLVSDFLKGPDAAMDYLHEVAREGEQYNGFSLLVHDGRTMGFYSNRGPEPSRVTPGVHGLSNHLLDTPWPKVEEGKLDLLTVLSGGPVTPAPLLGLLDRRDRADDERLPETGVGIARERELSPRFIRNPHYGTRSSTVILVDADNEVLFRERTFDAHGEVRGDEVVGFSIAPGTV